MASTTMRSSNLKSDEFWRLIPPSRDRNELKSPARSRANAPSFSRLRFTASTTIAPSRHASIICGINAGGCWRSESIVTTASPLATRRPASNAASLPKLRVKRSPLMRGVLLRQIPDAVEGLVAAAVIDDDDFQVHPAGGQGLQHDVDGARDAGRLVVRRNNDTQQLWRVRVHRRLNDSGRGHWAASCRATSRPSLASTFRYPMSRTR